MCKSSGALLGGVQVYGVDAAVLFEGESGLGDARSAGGVYRGDGVKHSVVEVCFCESGDHVADCGHRTVEHAAQGGAGLRRSS